jgi:hypothetical protein
LVAALRTAVCVESTLSVVRIRVYLRTLAQSSVQGLDSVRRHHVG